MNPFDPRQWPIRWWLTALNVAVLAATLVVLGGFALFQLDDALARISADHLRDQARPLLSAVRGPAPSPSSGPSFPNYREADRPGIQGPRLIPPNRPPGGGPRPGGPWPDSAERRAELIATALRGPDSGAMVFDADGQLLAVSEVSEGSEPWPSVDRAHLDATLAGAEREVVVRQQTRRTLVLLLPLMEVDGRQLGVVQIMRSLDLIDQLSARLRDALLFGTVLAAVLAGAVGFRATRSALAPLDRVIAAARRIEAGHVTERLRLRRRDEIGELAEAFDTMLDRLSTVLEAQKRFVADAAHELRTPLTALGGAVEMLQLGADRGDPATVRRLLSGMEREIGRLSRLVAGLLTLSRLDSEQPLNLAPVNLAVLLAEVAGETDLMASGQSISCVLDATPSVMGDADRLKQALLNLSANALAFTPSGGRIEFRLGQQDGVARLVVADTGVGIDPSLLPRITQRFVRGDASRSRETGGAGLGLAIVNGIVQAHGGTLMLTSEFGKGTRAEIELPIIHSASPARSSGNAQLHRP